MNEEDINPEEGLEEDIKKNEEKINEEYQEQKYGNEEIRKKREDEGTLDYRKRIYPDYKANRRKNQQRLGDDDIQAQGDAKLNPTGDMLAPKTDAEIEAARKGIEEAKKKLGGTVPEKDSDGFLQLVGKGLTVFGEAMDTVDRNVLGRIGLGDKNLYTARRGIIDGLSERHVALALLGEFLLPDTVDLATFGLGYIPKRFLKTPKLLKAWAKSTKAATRAESAGDAIGASLLGGRPRLAQRTGINELGDEVFDNVVNANKATQRPTPRPLTTPEKQKAAILAGKGDALDLDAAVRGPGLEGKPGTPKYSPTVRKETTKIDRALVNELQKKYGGTD